MNQHSDITDKPGKCGQNECPEIDVYAPCHNWGNLAGQIWNPVGALTEWPSGDDDPNWLAVDIEELHAALEKAKAFLASPDDTGV